jgi:hypothetical protein
LDVNKKKVYVFVHGLTVASQGTDGKIEIAMPRVRGHVYKAGSWLAETSIESGNTIELIGVTGGTAPAGDLYSATFLPIFPKRYPITKRRRAATVIVPRPVEILGLLRTQYSDYALRLNSIPVVNYPLVSDVLVLVYTYDHANQVLLDGHYWQPCLTPDAISLHLIATSEVPESAQHVADTEDALSEVFTDYPGCSYKRLNAPPWMDSQHPRFGLPSGFSDDGGYIIDSNRDFAFALAELESPQARARRLERLGRMHRERRRINCLWHRPDPLCADITACGTT